MENNNDIDVESIKTEINKIIEESGLLIDTEVSSTEEEYILNIVATTYCGEIYLSQRNYVVNNIKERIKPSVYCYFNEHILTVYFD